MKLAWLIEQGLVFSYKRKSPSTILMGEEAIKEYTEYTRRVYKGPLETTPGIMGARVIEDKSLLPRQVRFVVTWDVEVPIDSDG